MFIFVLDVLNWPVRSTGGELQWGNTFRPETPNQSNNFTVGPNFQCHCRYTRTYPLNSRRLTGSCAINCMSPFICFFYGSTALYGPGSPRFVEVSWSHTLDTPQSYDSSGRGTSSSQRPLLDNTQHSQETDINAPGGIRTHDPSKRAAEDPLHGPWDRVYPKYIKWNCRDVFMCVCMCKHRSFKG
jgi:hypothetical protein